MAGSDPVDTHGHTVTIAQAQEPLLDASHVASTDYRTNPPTGDHDTIILGSSAAEVAAQIANAVPVDES